MRYGIILCSIGLLVAGAVYAADTPQGNPTDTPTELVEYLKLNTAELGGFSDLSKKEAPKYELNTFTMVNLLVDDNNKSSDNYTPSIYNLLNKIKSTYIIRAQVKKVGANTKWEELIVINAFTRVLIAEGKNPPIDSGFEPYELKPDVFKLTPYVYEEMAAVVLDSELISALETTMVELEKSIEGNIAEKEEIQTKSVEIENAQKELEEFKSSISELRIELISPDIKLVDEEEEYQQLSEKTEEFENRLNEYEKSFAALSGEAKTDMKGVESEIKKAQEDIKHIKNQLDFTKNNKTVFSFNAANCYVKDVNFKAKEFKAEDGDELRIQVFRVEPLVYGKGKIIYQENEMYFTFREYGWFVHVSPAIFYVADANLRKNFNAQNFNVTSKGPGGGFNLYLSYTGTNAGADWVFNRFFPSLSFAVVDYLDRERVVGAGTPKENIIKNEHEAKFSLGLSWPFFIEGLRDKANFTVLLYDLDFDHVLIDVNFSPNIDIKGLFSKSGDPKVTKLN